MHEEGRHTPGAFQVLEKKALSQKATTSQEVETGITIEPVKQ
jgi:hypothetical protein